MHEGMNEWNSLQAALELSVCVGSDGQGAQGTSELLPPAQPCPARGPGVILCLSLELWVNPECNFSSKGTGQQQLSHPSTSQ